MDIITTSGGWLFLLRWLHFLAGITWIGILYYFNFIQTPFFGTPLGGDAKSPMVRGLVPNALWWFRWGAMFTFLSGWTIVLWNLHLGQPIAGPWIAQIVAGGLMGTLMWANVWFVIWPAQKVVIRSTEQAASGGQAIPEAAARGARAGLASRVNTLFSIPMLFLMGSATHFTFVKSGSSVAWWLCVLVIVTAVEAQALLGPGLPTQKPLATVKGTIHAGLAVALVVYVVGCLVS